MRPLLVFLCVTITVPAFADGNYEEAKRHYFQAEKAFKLEKYRVAAEEYEASYNLYPAPGLLWNLGQAYRKFDQKKALHYYQMYLDSAKPGTRDGRYLREAEAIVKELEPVVAAQEKARETPPAGVVSPDPEQSQQPSRAQTPSSTVRPNSNSERESSVPGATPKSPAIPIANSLPNRHSAETDLSGNARRADRVASLAAGISLSIATVAAAVIGGAILGHASQLDDDAASATTVSRRNALHSSADDFRTGAWVSLGIGGATLIGSAVAWSFFGLATRDARRVSVSLAPSPGGASLVLGGGW